jgi:selenide,water dikinase
VTQIDENHVYTEKTTSNAAGIDTTVDTKMMHTIPYTLCIWSTGAGAHPLSQHLYEQRQLDCDPKSHWIRVHPTLQSISHPYVFAAGDCCTIIRQQHPNTNDNDNNNPTPSSSPSPLPVPKAGVYAVRSGPILIENLTRYLESIRGATIVQNPTVPIHSKGTIPTSQSDDDTLTLLEYQPQDDFLKLLVCGDGTAIGFRFGLVLQGEWVFRLKDDIDQSFMKLFDVSGLVKPTRNDNNNTTSSTSDRPLMIGKYNTEQYDSSIIQNVNTVVGLDPNDAAALLRRTDDNVNIHTVRWILTKMGNDITYRNAVVNSFYQHVTVSTTS